MNTISEIAAVLRSLKSAVIFTHMRPDGDAVGSGIALSRALDLLNIPNQLVNEGGLPQKFRFLAGAEKFLTRPRWMRRGTSASIRATSAASANFASSS